MLDLASDDKEFVEKKEVQNIFSTSFIKERNNLMTQNDILFHIFKEENKIHKKEALSNIFENNNVKEFLMEIFQIKK